MDKDELIQEVWDKLDDFKGAASYDSSEIETTLDALATALVNLARFHADAEGHGQPDENEDEISLLDVLKVLGAPNKGRNQLDDKLTELKEVLQAADYDSDADEDEDRISEIKGDIYLILKRELDAMEKMK